MVDPSIHHRRTHSLLLIQRLLALRDGSSPFTLIQDSLEQSGRPLIKEWVRRAKASKVTVIFVSFETSKPPPGVDVLIKARRKEPSALQKEILQATCKTPKNLLVIDTLYALSSNPSLHIPTFLSSLISPQTSLLAVYHLDIPLPISTHQHSTSAYTPSPLTLLKYLATTIFTVHSFAQVLARKRAAERSLAEPLFGLADDTEGVLVGLGANDPRGVVLEMELRRKSGRGVAEWYFLPSPSPSPSPSAAAAAAAAADSPAASRQTTSTTNEKIILLDDHPLFRPQVLEEVEVVGEEQSTFNLGLTEKQRRDREGVVLPYFDAQREGGGGEGGRILYDLGVEDDFDEEEDEI